MSLKNSFVVDTNVLISQLLFPLSPPGKAFRKALFSHTLLTSEETLVELTQVLSRSKFDPYLTIEERQELLRHLSFIVELVPHIVPIKACRDLKDDKFLSLAIAGKARFILTGDQDLLTLDPFEDVRILSCTSYLEENKSSPFLHESRQDLRQRSR